MPRIRQKADEYSMRNLIAEVNAQCGRYGYTSQKSLGEALGVCQSTAGSYLRNPESIKFGALRSMVKVLRLDPVVVLKALGHTNQDIKKLQERR